MSNLQTYHHFKLDFRKVDQPSGGKWLIHGTKRRFVNSAPGGTVILWYGCLLAGTSFASH